MEKKEILIDLVLLIQVNIYYRRLYNILNFLIPIGIPYYFLFLNWLRDIARIQSKSANICENSESYETREYSVLEKFRESDLQYQFTENKSFWRCLQNEYEHGILWHYDLSAPYLHQNDRLSDNSIF